MLFWDEQKPKRKRLSKIEWEAVKKLSGNKCAICGDSEKRIGVLKQAHIKAHSKGGSQVVPMCSNCHDKYDRGTLTATQLRKLKLTPEQYKRLIPSKKQKKHWLDEMP